MNAIGEAASKEPELPISTISPDMVANSRARNQLDWILIKLTNMTPIPVVVMKRATYNKERLSAMANSSAPRPDISNARLMTRRGPNTSAKIPAGICRAAYVQK